MRREGIEGIEDKTCELNHLLDPELACQHDLPDTIHYLTYLRLVMSLVTRLKSKGFLMPGHVTQCFTAVLIGNI